MWERLKNYLADKSKDHLRGELNTLKKSEAWGVIKVYLQSRAEEAKFSMYAAVQTTGKEKEAAFEAGRELTLLYVIDNCITDLDTYLAEGVPAVENPRPNEE